MSSTSSTGSTGSTGSSSSTSSSKTSSVSDKWSSLGVDDFMKLMVTELQNQDPTSPTDTSQIMSQVSQISAIQSNQQLTKTMSSLQLQQNISTASTLIGKEVNGKTASGDSVSGVVDYVLVDDGDVSVYVGEKAIPVKNILEIYDPSVSSDTTSSST